MLEKIKDKIKEYKEHRYHIEQEYIYGSSDRKDLLKESLMSYRFAIHTLEQLITNEIEEANFTYAEYIDLAKVQAPKDEPDPEKMFISAFGPKDQRVPFTTLTPRGLSNFIQKTGCSIGGGTYIHLGMRDVKNMVPKDATHRSKIDEEPGYYHYYKKI